MKKIIKKNITLDGLAGMVQRGFLDVNKRFDEVDKKFDLLEAEMNARFDQLEKIIFHEYKNRIEKLEDQVKDLQTDFRQLVGFYKK
jgi:tetrahydromethanopterin S-methyltransferase subunit G